MKKSLIALLCLVCVGCMLCSSAISATSTYQIGGGTIGETPVVNLASGDGSSATSSAMPSKDEPLPEGIQIWDGTVATAFAGGSGTTEDPFQISSPAEWAYFINLCNKAETINDPLSPVNARFYTELSYVLTADLCFNPDFEMTVTEDENGEKVPAPKDETGLRETPVYLLDVDFAGVLDGNNHRIYNLYATRHPKNAVMSGVFSDMSGTITRLHFVRGFLSVEGGGDQYNPGKACGGIAANMTGTIVDTSSSMTVYSARIIGGICGTINSAATLSNVCFLGSAYGGAVAGGIIGLIKRSGENITVSNCINYGDVYSAGLEKTGGETRGAGGILGGVRGCNTLSISNCINYGTVESGGEYAGGIAGRVGDDFAAPAGGVSHIVRFCANYGAVTAVNGVGGLIGSFRASKYYQTNEKCLEFGYCYSYGSVTATAGTAGGFIGTAQIPVYVLNSAAGGSVSAHMGAGGFVGTVNSTFDQWKVGASSVEVYGSLFDGIVSTLDTGSENGSSAGAVVGRLYVGNEQYSGVSVGGCMIAGTIRGRDIGGIIGKCCYDTSAKRSKSKLILNYTVLTTRIECADEAAVYGRLVGGLDAVGSPVDSTTEGEYLKYAYVASDVYVGVEDTATPTTSKIVDIGGKTMVLKSITFEEENLTNGKYLNILSTYTTMNSGVTKWSAGEEYPMPQGIAQIYEALPDVDYTGEEITLTHSKWSGIDPLVRYTKLQDDGTWEPLSSAPSETGTYRAEVVLFSTRAYGGAAVEFQIQKQRIDMSQYGWQEKNVLYYNGQAQSISLVGLLDCLEVVYGGDVSATNVGIYETYVVSVNDPTGNYEILGVDQIPSFSWKIDTRILRPANIVWSGIPNGGTTPQLTYNEKEQSVYLMDVTDPQLDLTALLNITYSGASATTVGEYLARASIPPLASSSNVSWEGIMNTSPATSWSIVPREIYPDDYLSFGLLEVTYDGAYHTLDWSKDEPQGVVITPKFSTSVSYKNAGQYEYPFEVRLTDTQNNVLTIGGSTTTISRTFTISPASPTISAKNLETTYTGEIISFTDELLGGREATFGTSVQAIREELDACGSIRYVYYKGDVTKNEDGTLVGEEIAPENVVNAGKYTVAIIFEPGENRNFAVTTVTASLIIRRATCILEGNIALRDGSVLYNGQPQNLALKHEEDLPDFVTPVYSEGYVDPGQYTVVCNFVFSSEMEGNYEPLPSMTATLTILTYNLVDEDTGLQICFPTGEPTFLRLLVKERQDVDSFNTAWQVAWNTSLKLLYQVELKEGVTPVSDFGGSEVEVKIPIGKYRFSAGLVPVSITIDENGKFTITEYEDYDFEEIDDVYYIVFKTTELAYYGVVTADSNGGQITWFVVLGAVAICCAIVLGITLISRSVKKRRERKAAEEAGTVVPTPKKPRKGKKKS